MKISERIKKLIDADALIPERDAAKVIRPAGIDAKVRKEAYQQCYKIALQVENDEQQHTFSDSI